jgi:hypothetical protein
MIPTEGINEQLGLNNYWVRRADDNTKYADISVYTRPTKPKLQKLSSIFTREVSSGTTTKHFGVRDGKINLIKQDECRRKEFYCHFDDIFSEILSTPLANAIGVNATNYKLEVPTTDSTPKPQTVCPVFTDENTDAYSLAELNNGIGISSAYSVTDTTQDIISKVSTRQGIPADEIKRYIGEATVLDTLLQCNDRLPHNISILVDANTNKPKGFAPHYDFGCCSFNKNQVKMIYEPFRNRYNLPPETILDDLNNNGISIQKIWNGVSSAVSTVLADKNKDLTRQIYRLQRPYAPETYLDGYKYNAEFLDNAINKN